LGASYVLSALTLVSPKAREALPWLYQSVAAGSPTVAAGVQTGPRAVVANAADANVANIVNTINNTFNIMTTNNNMYIGIQDDIDDTILYNILTAINMNTNMNNMNNTNNAVTNANGIDIDSDTSEID